MKRGRVRGIMTPYRWTIAFDADDTLWHNERSFQTVFDRFAAFMSDFADEETLQSKLHETEIANLATYGFGVKGYALSMIETALTVSVGQVSTQTIEEIVDMAKGMLTETVEVLPAVEKTLSDLRDVAELIIITKGDLLDQERKVAASGLRDYFDNVHVVSDKTAETYASIFAHHDTPNQMMVGNSLKSDVIPALNAGAWGVHIPHEHEWVLEKAEPPTQDPKFRKVEKISDLPALIAEIES